MSEQRQEREQKMLQDFPKGAIVRVKDPDAYIASVASKLRDRLGEITGHQMPTPNPIVNFRANGRKTEHRKVFTTPDRDLEIVTDEQQIAAWREAVKASELREAARRAAK